MKNLILALALVASSTAFADSSTKASKVKDQYQNVLTSMVGMNGVGISGCDKKSGELSLEKGFVHCIVVNFSDNVAFDNATATFNAPFKVDGVWVSFRVVGVIRPKPGVTIHN